MKELKPGMTTAEAGLEAVEKVLQETALAYYHANPNAQYNVGASLTVVGVQGPDVPEGPLFSTGCMQPEEASPDFNYYGVCRSFTAEVFYDAFRMEVPGLNCRGFGLTMVRFPECVVYRFGDARPEFVTPGAFHISDKPRWIREVRSGLRPGDTILATPNDGHSGHVIMYLGDCFGNGTDYVIHCWPIGGGSWDKETGVNKREPFGAIVMQTADEFLFSEGSSPNWSLAADRMTSIYVYRFTLAEGFGNLRFTDAAVTRYNCPGLIVTKTPSVGFYGTVLPGEPIRVTERFVNKSGNDYELTVREPIPEGTVFSEAPDAESVTDREVVWKVRVPACDFAEVTYEVRVTADPGTELFFRGGRAGTLPTRELRVRTAASRFTYEEELRLKSLANYIPGAYRNGHFFDLAFVKIIYREFLGRKADLPDTLAEWLSELCEVANIVPDYSGVLIPKKKLSEKGARYAAQVLPRFTYGKYFMIPGDQAENKERALDILESYFEPGDVLVSMRGENTLSADHPEGIRIAVYIGDGRVILHDTSDSREAGFDETFAVSQIESYAVVIRPRYLV